MKKPLRIFIILVITFSLLITSEVCSAEDYYYAPPASSYSVSSAEVIVGVAVLAAIVAGVALLAKHHDHDSDYPQPSPPSPPPPRPYLRFSGWTDPVSPMYVGGEPQYLDYTIENIREDETNLYFYGYTDPMIVRNHAIPHDCQNYLPGYSSCNIELVVYPNEARPIRDYIEIADDLDFSISRPIDIDVYYRNPAQNPLQVEIPHISNMTINKDKSQNLDYMLHNHSNQSIDISKIEGFNSNSSDEPVARDTSVEENCDSTLAANSSCKIRLKVTPNQPGEIAKKLVIGNKTTNYLTTPINLFVHALDIVYQQSTTVLYALPHQVNTDGKITIKNYYNKAVKTDAIIRPVNGIDLKFLSTSCGETLAPNASCEYRLQYQAADSNKLKLGESQQPFVTGINSTVQIKYNLENQNVYLKFPLQTFLPSDSRILNYPANTTTFNSLPSLNIVKKVKIGDLTYAATADKGLAISKDNGISWKTYTIGNGLGSNHINDVTANQNGDKIYVATDNGLAISNDFGATWKNYNKLSSLGSNLIKAIAISSDGTHLYVATTDQGLIYSADSGNSWKNLHPVKNITALSLNNDATKLMITFDDGKNKEELL